MDSISCEKWNVLILAENEEHSKVYRVPITSTIGRVLDLWHRDQSISGRWILATSDGVRLCEDTTVAEVGESVPGSKLVNLQIEEWTTLRIEVLGEESSRSRSLSVRFSMTPMDLHPHVRQLLSLPERRIFRLRVKGNVLRYDLTLAAQKVCAESVLEVDLAFELFLTDGWEDRTQRHLLFSSEPLSDADTAEQRFFLASTRLNGSRDLAHSLPASVRSHPNLCLNHLQQRQVCTLADTQLVQRAVWPHESALNLVRPPSRPLLHCSRRPISAGESCRAAGVQERGLVVASRTVAVALSNGRGAVVRLPHGATGADLKQAVEAVEGRSVRLTVGGRGLGEEERMETVVKQSVKASVAEERLEVRLSGRTLEWRCHGGLRFSQLAHEVAERSGEAWEEVRRVRFVCCGCGRRVRNEEEEWQEIPAACCRVRSLRLRVERLRDCGTQAECWIERKSSPTNKTPASFADLHIEEAVTVKEAFCQTEVEMSNKQCHAVIKLKHKYCQTLKKMEKLSEIRVKVDNNSCQTDISYSEDTREAKVVSSVTQHPPPIERRNVWLRNFTSIGPRLARNVIFQLSPYPSVKEMKTEIANFFNAKTTDWKLYREVAVDRNDGVFVFPIFKTVGTFADAVGRVRSCITTSTLVQYDDDEALFVIPSRCKAVIQVGNKRDADEHSDTSSEA